MCEIGLVSHTRENIQLYMVGGCGNIWKKIYGITSAPSNIKSLDKVHVIKKICWVKKSANHSLSWWKKWHGEHFIGVKVLKFWVKCICLCQNRLVSAKSNLIEMFGFGRFVPISASFHSSDRNQSGTVVSSFLMVRMLLQSLIFQDLANLIIFRRQTN